MDSSIFCVLCGGPFDLEPHVWNLNIEAETYQWIYDVRLLCAQSALTNMNMTYLEEEHRNILGAQEVFLSEKTHWTFGDGDFFRLDNSLYQVLNDDHEAQVIFPLHNSCINIACRAIESTSRGNGTSALIRLKDALQTQFHHHKYFAGGFGHDLFDLYAEYSNYGPRSLLAVDELGWWGEAHEKFLVDPIHIPNLTSFIFKAVQATPQTCSIPAEAYVPAKEPCGIECLPPELLEQICNYLPPFSTINLHRTSRTLAFKIRLDNRFWRNHILDGSLLPHIWDLPREQLEIQRDGEQQSGTCFELQWGWKSVAKLLYKKDFPISGRDPRLEGMPPGFWNRCRIWKIAEEACLA